MNVLVNFKKICSLQLVRLVSLETSIEEDSKKGFLRLNHWRFSRKGKSLLVVAIVAVLLVSVFAFIPKQKASEAKVIPQSIDNSTATPTPSPTPVSKTSGSTIQNIIQGITGLFGGSLPKAPGLIESAQTINSTVWRQVATNAWAYFQPNVGIDSTSGLPYAGGKYYTYFTDWDLGVYIQSAIDAQKLDLIGPGNSWSFNTRINYVLTFLETRDLNAYGYPYQFYDAVTKKENTLISSTETADMIDTGRLFVALDNLKTFNSSLAPRINNIVYDVSGNGSNYAALVPFIAADSQTSTSIYSYYSWSGFASFWPNQLSNAPSTILKNIFSAGNVTTYPYGNVSLPEGSIVGDPLFCSVFELNTNDTGLMTLARQVYLASSAYYNATTNFAAFSEGNSPSGFVYEFNVTPNGTTWTIMNTAKTVILSINPVVYNKIAFSFLSLYNTTYARATVVYLEEKLPNPTNGYCDGADTSGNQVSLVGSNTNGLILDAATYALQNNS